MKEKKENCIGNDTPTGHKNICTVLKGIETEKNNGKEFTCNTFR
jgi:hypothetical protein